MRLTPTHVQHVKGTLEYSRGRNQVQFLLYIFL